MAETESNHKLPDRYKTNRQINEGGMGVVLLACDSLLDRTVAIKIIRIEDPEDATLNERFVREAKFLSTLDHPNIVKLLSFGLTQAGEPFYVMEELKGESLLERLSGGPLSMRLFLEIFIQLCDGLQYAHAKGIVHRDIKPSNVLLCTEEGKLIVKIIDFGIATANKAAGPKQKTLTKTSAIMGTPAYMSPEQCAGMKVDNLSDIYSLGCLMFECLTGNLPFTGSNGMETMYKHMNEAAPSVEQLVKDRNLRSLGRLVDSCLKKQADERPPSVSQILNALQSIQSNTFSSDAIFIEADRSKKATQLSGKARSIIAVLLILCSVSIAIYFSKPKPQSEQDPLAEKMAKLISRCSQLKIKQEKCKDKEQKYKIQVALSSVYRQIASLQLADKDIRDGISVQKAGELEANLTEAMNGCEDSNAAIDLKCKKAYCLFFLGKRQEAINEIKDCEKFLTDRYSKQTQKYLLFLLGKVEFLALANLWTEAGQTFDTFLGLWKKVFWSDPELESIDLRLSELTPYVVDKKTASILDRQSQTELINKIATAIKSKEHGGSDNLLRNDLHLVQKTKLQKTLSALKRSEKELIPRLSPGPAYSKISKETKTLISEYEKLLKTDSN